MGDGPSEPDAAQQPARAAHRPSGAQEPATASQQYQGATSRLGKPPAEPMATAISADSSSSITNTSSGALSVASASPFASSSIPFGDSSSDSEDEDQEGVDNNHLHQDPPGSGAAGQSFFGGSPFGGGGSSRGRRQRRGEDVVHPLKVSLEDLYNGTSKKLSLSRNAICSKCKGKGSKSGASMKCSGCQGSGIKVSIRHLGPSMIQQMQHACNECKGTGETINDKDRCTQCKGEKVVQEKKVLEVIVEKGMQNGQKITFPGEADEAPDTVTGDIVFILQQKEHPKFKRKGDDLFVEHTLSLTEALCGFQFLLAHLDGRQLLIKSEPGEVVKPDQYKGINDEGMPMYQRSFMKGKLYIHFSVEFPDTLSPEQCKTLEAVLPPRSSVQLTDMELDECEETTLHDVNIEDEMRRKQAQAQEAYDEDEDMPGGAQRVQCAQQ